MLVVIEALEETMKVSIMSLFQLKVGVRGRFGGKPHD